MVKIKHEDVFALVYGFLAGDKASICYDVEDEFFERKHLCRFPLAVIDGTPVEMVLSGEQSPESAPGELKMEKFGYWLPEQKLLLGSGFANSGAGFLKYPDDYPEWAVSLGTLYGRLEKKLESRAEAELRAEFPDMDALGKAIGRTYNFKNIKGRTIERIVKDESPRLFWNDTFVRETDDLTPAVWEASTNTEAEDGFYKKVMDDNREDLMKRLWDVYEDERSKKELRDNPPSEDEKTILAIHDAVSRPFYSDAKTFRVTMEAAEKRSGNKVLIERHVEAKYIRNLSDELSYYEFPNGSDFKSVPARDIVSIKFGRHTAYSR